MADVGGIAVDQLRSIVERIEHLEEEKKNMTADIGQIYAEAKGNGYDVKAIRKVVSLRKIDPSDRREQEALLEVYREALAI